MIEKVEWDSKNFNLMVGKLNITDESTFCSDTIRKKTLEGGYNVVYINSESRIPQLEQNGVFCNETILYRQAFNNLSSDYNLGGCKNHKT